MTSARPKAADGVSFGLTPLIAGTIRPAPSKKLTDPDEDQQVLWHRGKPRHFIERLVFRGAAAHRGKTNTRRFSSLAKFYPARFASCWPVSEGACFTSFAGTPSEMLSPTGYAFTAWAV
jgi:hypothetical protein